MAERTGKDVTPPGFQDGQPTVVFQPGVVGAQDSRVGVLQAILLTTTRRTSTFDEQAM